MPAPHLSPFQFTQNPDGSMGLEGFPHVRLATVEGQGHVTGRDWQKELGLPRYFEQWEALARIRGNGLSRRSLRFIVLDESPTRVPGHPRYRAQAVRIPEAVQLELAHAGFCVGVVNTFLPAFDEQRDVLCQALGIALPADLVLEGNFIIGQATLFDSPLAEKAWEGLARGVFSHVCPVIFMPDNEPEGSGTLMQVSLVPGDVPGLPNARVLSWWETSGE